MNREDINFLSQFIQENKLENLYKKIEKDYEIKVLTNPTEQTLLVPVKDPISGGDFYAGEVLVTSTIVEVNGVKGWSMVLDTNEELSLKTAVLDASFEANIFKEEILDLLEKTKNEIVNKNAIYNKKVNSTRVSFDLM
ncbi:phosphonate C-P lyase system protein PhnG [Halarcobacter sp.]|uniref:phosphonate C-P lyase system protein PhnG n=1 Tax=Halarcobacter sp. TaxID=2321133 RepID=UPI002AAB69F4|nr:phosphonate C-P lyase system protein PhnG [Halarcobacter sp.]